MIYTKTIIIKASDYNKDIKSLEHNNIRFFLPINLEEKLDKEVQYIYKENGRENILSMTITPKIEYFLQDGITIPIPVIYNIVYVYKSDEI